MTSLSRTLNRYVNPVPQSKDNAIVSKLTHYLIIHLQNKKKKCTKDAREGVFTVFSTKLPFYLASQAYATTTNLYLGQVKKNTFLVPARFIF